MDRLSTTAARATEAPPLTSSCRRSSFSAVQETDVTRTICAALIVGLAQIIQPAARDQIEVTAGRPQTAALDIVPVVETGDSNQQEVEKEGSYLLTVTEGGGSHAFRGD